MKDADVSIFVEVLKLFQDEPLLMLLALFALVFMVIKVTKKNRIGSIKAKRTTIEQSAEKGNEIDKIESDDVEVIQR